MIFEYTEEMFEKDKKEMLVWLEKNWIYKSKYGTYFGNILRNLKDWVEAIKRVD